MSTNAGALLNIMLRRLEMHKAGTTNPAETIKVATEKLVNCLSKIDPSEAIEIKLENNTPIRAKYIRSKTGEVLAEINE